MGLLNLLVSKSNTPTLMRLPSGSFTVDRSGRVLASTLPNSFPELLVSQIAQAVLETFRSAELAKIPLTELITEYAALKLTARELRGGVIIFLNPRALGSR